MRTSITKIITLTTLLVGGGGCDEDALLTSTGASIEVDGDGSDDAAEEDPLSQTRDARPAAARGETGEDPLEPEIEPAPAPAPEPEPEPRTDSDIDVEEQVPLEPRSPVDPSQSYLDAAAIAFLEQAGVAEPSSVGATMWVDACRVMAHQGAGTFNSGETKACSWANVYPGWIIIETDYVVLQNKNNRGSASVSSTNGPVTISSAEFGSKFDSAISLATGAGDSASATKLDLEYQRLNGYSFKFDGAGNQLVATVRANGGLFEGSRIEIQAKARLLRVH